MNRRRFAPAVLALLLTACGFPTDDVAQPVPAGDLPAALRLESTVPLTTPESAPTETEIATIWLVRNDRLVAVRHEVAAPADAARVVAELLLGPSPDEQDGGLRSALPDATVVGEVTVARGSATVELPASFADIPAGDQLLAVGQLVLTLTDVRGVGTVQFTSGGTAIAVPVPTGESTDQALFREQFVPLRGGTTGS